MEVMSCRSTRRRFDSRMENVRTPSFRRRSEWGVSPWQVVDLRRADEIVLVQPADRVRLIADAHVAPAAFDVGMVVFGVGDVRHGVDEAHGTVEVGELELALQGLAVLDDLPAWL